MPTSQGEILADTIPLRREYDRRKHYYERLLNIVSLILHSAVDKRDIKIHSFKSRVKKYESFAEKIERKRYKEPFKECTDIAGVRVVCLFLSQVEAIRKIIEEEFEVVEVTDKKTTKKYDQFGYLSLHMLVKIPQNRQGFTEFTGMDDFVCEIQVRTILQEAWAEIEHYLNYKTTKEEKNDELLRKIFSLAGMFEVADSTFEEIHSGFSRLVQKKSPRTTDVITPLNLFKFSQAYFSWFSSDWNKKQERSYFKLSNELRRMGIENLGQMQELLDRNRQNLEKYESHYQRKEKKRGRYFTPVGLMRAALALEFGKKFDLVFGLKGYADRVAKAIY